eukprot:TRINITY_DN33682_c1_g1_i1.p1 TRINITY_DN33682_c1_g1~~TRINITY_DN33682_c1_g1_i1.p1  ORF type:complete len:139 (+),score=11.88 TRINITY_DN33682_c1_g1_i1:186-602(+)
MNDNKRMLLATSPANGSGLRPLGVRPCSEIENQVCVSFLPFLYFKFLVSFDTIFAIKLVPNPRSIGHTTPFTGPKPKSQALIVNTFISHSTLATSHKPQDPWPTVTQPPNNQPNYPIDPTTTSKPFSHNPNYIPQHPK